MSMTEPGIGLMIWFCIIQFIIGNIILLVIESRIFSRIKFACKTNDTVEDSGENIEKEVFFV